MAIRKVRVCHLVLAPAFVHLCETGGISPRDALQRLLDAMSIYAHLAPKNKSQSSAAMVLFQQYLQWRAQPQDPHDFLAEHYVRQLIQLAQSNKTPNRRQQEQQEIINKWYRAWWEQDTETIRLSFSEDVLVLERLFHISIADFLQYFINHLSVDAMAKENPTTNEKLAAYFFMGPEE